MMPSPSRRARGTSPSGGRALPAGASTCRRAVPRERRRAESHPSKSSAGAPAAEGLGHGSGNSRERTFERYGAALVAAWRRGNIEGENGTGSGGNEGSRRGDARPFLFDGAWDALRALRFVTRGDEYGDLTDPARVGIGGIARGMYAWLVKRDLARSPVGPIIGVQHFAWGLLNDSWRARVDSLPPALFAAAAEELVGDPRAVDASVVGAVYRRICPGLIDELDGPASLPLISPRPLLVVNGELDPRCPFPGLMNAVTETKAAYASEGKTSLFRTLVQRGTPHRCTPEMVGVVNRWFDETLRPARPDTALPTRGHRDPNTWIEL